MMKIISGIFKGQVLKIPPNTKTRPSTGMVRESIFNILFSLLSKNELNIKNATILDAFAGSGALGIEALSRGAKHATFIEINQLMYNTLQNNLQLLKICDYKYNVVRENAYKFSIFAKNPVNIVFLDPPYHKGLLEISFKNLFNNGWIDNSTIVVTESSIKEPLPNLSRDWHVIKEYGQIRIAIG